MKTAEEYFTHWLTKEGGFDYGKVGDLHAIPFAKYYHEQKLKELTDEKIAELIPIKKGDKDSNEVMAYIYASRGDAANVREWYLKNNT